MRGILPLVFCGALLLGGCGRQDEGGMPVSNKLTAKAKKEKVESIKTELERLKAEITELRGKTQALEKELEQVRVSRK